MQACDLMNDGFDFFLHCVECVNFPGGLLCLVGDGGGKFGVVLQTQQGGREFFGAARIYQQAGLLR